VSEQDQGAGSGHRVRLLAGREVLFDPEGFLVKLEDWQPDLALLLAGEDGMAGLGEAHWKVINFLRDYYLSRGKAPLNQQLRQGTGLSLLEIEGLFPGGLKQGARRLAGLPNPRGCL
jgi:dissimilatory sulfite reductase related protein